MAAVKPWKFTHINIKRSQQQKIYHLLDNENSKKVNNNFYSQFFSVAIKNEQMKMEKFLQIMFKLGGEKQQRRETMYERT